MCDMSGINGYYHYDNVNYSQTIRPEECRLIYLAAVQLCVGVCMFECVCVSDGCFFHISACIRVCVRLSVCVCVCACVIASNLFVRQGNYFRLRPNAEMLLVIYKTSD